MYAQLVLLHARRSIVVYSDLKERGGPAAEAAVTAALEAVARGCSLRQASRDHCEIEATVQRVVAAAALPAPPTAPPAPPTAPDGCLQLMADASAPAAVGKTTGGRRRLRSAEEQS